MERLGVSVIGAGDMGNRHLAGWSKVEGVDLISVADPDTDRAQAASEKYGVAARFADYREAIAQEGVNVVSVCVPNRIHPEVTIFAAQHGADVFCEKPICTTLPEADRMMEACQEAGVRFAIGFCGRHSRQNAKIKELIHDQDAIGRPVIYWETGGAEIRPKRIMHDKNGNGGPVIDMFCHTIDHWREVFQSMPKRAWGQGYVFAQGRPELAHIKEPAIDSFIATVEYESGDLGMMTLTWGLPPGVRIAPQRRAVGPKGTLRPESGGVITVITEGGREEKLEGLETAIYDVEIADFADAIRNDRAPLVAPTDGKIALAVSLAVLKSIEVGGIPVEVEL